jgi:hypothetical protein
VSNVTKTNGVRSGNGLITITYTEPPSAPTCNGQTATIWVKDGVIQGGPNNGKTYKGKLNGTPGNDVIVGTSGNDAISAAGGNDLVCGGDGNDQLQGGDGDDTLFGQKGNDQLQGGNGNDTLSGGDDNDDLKGGDGNDEMTGGTGADKFNGGSGTDNATDFAPGETKTGVEVFPTADISLSTGPAGLPDFTGVTVNNAGPAAATVIVLVECPGTFTPRISPNMSFTSRLAGDGNYLSVTPIPSGGSRNFEVDCQEDGADGYAEVYSSSQPDPDSTPNNSNSSEDDYFVIS